MSRTNSVGYWQAGSADGPLTINEWHALQDEREAAKAAMLKASQERRAAEYAARSALAKALPSKLSLLLDSAFRGPLPGCADCEYYAYRCEDHTYRQEREVDTGVTDRREGTATGVLSGDRVCLFCANAFKAPERKGKPPVTCSDECATARRRAKDRARKAGQPYRLPEAVTAAQEALEDPYARPLPVRVTHGLTEADGYMPFEWNTGGSPDEGSTSPGVGPVLGDRERAAA